MLLPEVVNLKNAICADNKQKDHCICRRPCFEPMIACDAKHCHIEWYHYTCVNITIAPKVSWFCENCTAKNKKTRKKLNDSIVEVTFSKNFNKMSNI